MGEFVGSNGCEFGPYMLEDRHSLGGLTDLWSARVRSEHASIPRVLLKTTLPRLPDDRARFEALQSDARIGARLRHGHILRVVEAGWINGLHTVALEHFAGVSLRELAEARKPTRFPAALSVRIAVALCDALEYLHTWTSEEYAPDGLVHCDVSLDNLIVSPTGEMKLLAFGVASPTVAPMGLVLPPATDTLVASRAASGVLDGTFHAPPEWLRGESLDCRSNVYSAGAVLYELLFGVSPSLAGSIFQPLARHDDGHAMVPPALTRLIDPRLFAIVKRALAVDPADRPSSAAELRSELLTYAAATATDVAWDASSLAAGFHQCAPELAARGPDSGFSTGARRIVTGGAPPPAPGGPRGGDGGSGRPVSGFRSGGEGDAAGGEARVAGASSASRTSEAPAATPDDDSTTQLRSLTAAEAERHLASPPLPSLSDSDLGGEAPDSEPRPVAARSIAPEPAAKRPEQPAAPPGAFSRAATEAGAPNRTASVFDASPPRERAAAADVFGRYSASKNGSSLETAARDGTGGRTAEPRAPQALADAPAAATPRSRAAAEHFEAGWRYLRQGDYARALSAWEAAVACDPEHRAYQVNLQKLRGRLGR